MRHTTKSFPNIPFSPCLLVWNQLFPNNKLPSDLLISVEANTDVFADGGITHPEDYRKVLEDLTVVWLASLSLSSKSATRLLSHVRRHRALS